MADAVPTSVFVEAIQLSIGFLPGATPCGTGNRSLIDLDGEDQQQEGGGENKRLGALLRVHKHAESR